MDRDEILILTRTGGDKSASHELLNEAARRFMQKTGVTVPQTVDRAKGKPEFSPPCGVFFSVTHTKGFWACAFALQNVGMDAERERNCDRLAIARRFFHSEEAALVERSPESFFAVWTAKESYAKFTGQGVVEGFGDFSCADETGLRTAVGGAELKPLSCENGLYACVCAGKIGRITMEEF